MTRKTAKEYIRLKINDRKERFIYEAFLNVEIDISRRKVQKDLMAKDLKRFVKTAFNTGPVFELPSDLMEKANSINLMKASTGARASVTTNFTGANNDITFFIREPGTAGNITDVLQLVDGASSTTIQVYYNSDGTLDNIQVDFPSGITANALIAAFNADPVAGRLMGAMNAVGNSGAGTITLGVGVTYTTTGGTGSGWVDADETTPEDLSRSSSIKLMAGTQYFPKYAVKGGTDGSPIAEFYPKTITYSMMEYDYWLADMTADTEDLGLYQAGEEMVLKDVISKCFAKMKDFAKTAEEKQGYEEERLKYHDEYQRQLGAEEQDKKRLETANQTN